MEPNPYQSPLHAGVPTDVPLPAELAPVSPQLARVARNIRAICVLYMIFGVVVLTAGVVTLLADRETHEIPAPAAIILVAAGAAGVISSFGVLRKRKWGILVCQVVSALYLMNFPVGTILGGYFLLNIGKVKDQFQ